MHDIHLDRAAMPGPHAIHSMFDSSLCKMHYDLGTNKAPWSVAHFHGVKLHGIDIYDDKGIGGRKVLRNYLDIADNPTDDFLLAMPSSARINLAQGGRLEYCEPGRAILFSTAKPFSSSISAAREGGQYAQLLSRVSGAMLRQRVPHIDDYSNFTFATDSGAGKIVKSLLELAISEGATLSPSQHSLFSSMLIDAIANVVPDLPIPTATERQSKPSSFERVRQQATNFISRNISDPSLGVSRVAAHCVVSERYLHAAFAASSVRLGALIREMRLQSCRKALKAPEMGGKSITEIALLWGYEDPAHFSRAYKAMFGKSPRDDR